MARALSTRHEKAWHALRGAPTQVVVVDPDAAGLAEALQQR
jgi:hypothetical protein